MDNNGRMDCYFPKTPVEETVQTTENRASFSGVEQSGSTILTVAVAAPNGAQKGEKFGKVPFDEESPFSGYPLSSHRALVCECLQ